MISVIFNFSYIIQFSVNFKISFANLFLLIIFFRLITGFTVKYLVYVKSLVEGIEIFNEVQSIMAYLGIISNICIIFYINKHFIPLERNIKFFFLLITENLIFIIIKLIIYVRISNWFEFKK